MPSDLCITIRFFDTSPTFHGKGDGDEPEWPPSPLRLFQAIVDGAASRWRNSQFSDDAVPALRWLQSIKNVTVVAPPHKTGTPFRIAVPNNDLDVWAGPVSKGTVPKKQPNELKTLKQVRPTHILGDTLHYLFPLPNGQCPHLETLQSAARSITHLGWGIDMVAGDAAVITSDEADKLPGHRWRETPTGGVPLRVPMAGTLDDLMRKHQDFLQRISEDGFRPVPPLRAFRVARYHSATVASSGMPARPWCAFGILKPDFSRNAAFNTVRRTRDVAAWVRHATADIYQAMPECLSFVHGHDAQGNQLRGPDADKRLMFLPLPTINHALSRVESIRRVLIAAPPGDMKSIDFIRCRLASHELYTPDGEVVGVLNHTPAGDWVVRQYTGSSKAWSTVTPVILPGHDDHDPQKAEGLLRKAMVQAGLPNDLVNGIVELHWRSVGFRAGAELARSFLRPEQPRGPVYHVRVRFAHPVAGPLVVGAGRYRGFGLFAVEGDSP